MAGTLEMDLQESSVGVFPPSFCNWKLLLAVMVITEVSVVLVGLGHGGFPGWKWLGMASVYAQWMALFCASGLCVTRGWTSRLSARGAWIGCWLIALLLAMTFSYAAWLVISSVAPDIVSPQGELLTGPAIRDLREFYSVVRLGSEACGACAAVDTAERDVGFNHFGHLKRELLWI